MLQTTENELWKTARLTSFQKPQCNLIQSHFSLGSSHWSIQGSFCICCDAYTFFWHFEHGVIFMFHSVWWQFWLNTFVTYPVSSFNQCRLILTSGRSRGGAHPRPPLFLDQTEAQGAEKSFSKTPPPLSQGVDPVLLTGTMWQKTQNISYSSDNKTRKGYLF